MAELPVYPRAVAQWLLWRRFRIGSDVRAWARTNGRRRSPAEQGLPWLNFALIELLEQRLASAPSRVFEWGAGGSTVFYGERAASVVSVEHDGAWVASVADQLRSRGIDNVDLRHVPAARTPGPVAPVDPPLRASKLALFADYVAQVRDGGGLYDVIQVDAKARLECVAAARDQLAPGGWLVIDDVDKPGRYAGVRALLPPDKWQLRRTWGPGPASGLRLVTAAVIAERR